MTAKDFRRLALSLEGAEEGSHMGAADFRVGGRIFATLASQSQGYGNLMLNLEQQDAFVEELPEVFLPVAGGWGKMGVTHIRLAAASEDVLAGALHAAWKLRLDKNAKPARKRSSPTGRRLPAMILGLAGLLWTGAHARAAEPGCGQSLVDGTTPPATTFYIYPRQPLQPFYQWENNDGYCGEVSMMQAALNNGQWMSQFNARLICGAGLSQSGPDGACAAHRGQVDYNAQLLIEDPGTGVSGPDTYANAALCLSNSRLHATTYSYSSQAQGMAGYQDYMSWVKQEVISGHQVTIAILMNGGSDPQYDHEVAVIRIGTNHSPADPAYYPDDVVYFDDHGNYTLSGNEFTSNPAIPPGAGSNSTGCTPYVFGYTFDSLANTRAGANRKNAQAYSIIIPGDSTIQTYTGGSGYDSLPITGPHNYGFSVAGPEDLASVTVPVALSIVGPTVTEGVSNPRDPVAGYDYENPMIGTSVWGRGCTNKPPAAWMTSFGLQVNVSGLTPGTAYNLYEYEFSSVEGVGSGAALKVPVQDFNANAGLAARVTTFTAVDTTFQQTLTTTSDKIIVFRCVPVTAP